MFASYGTNCCHKYTIATDFGEEDHHEGAYHCTGAEAGDGEDTQVQHALSAKLIFHCRGVPPADLAVVKVGPFVGDNRTSCQHHQAPADGEQSDAFWLRCVQQGNKGGVRAGRNSPVLNRPEAMFPPAEPGGVTVSTSSRRSLLWTPPHIMLRWQMAVCNIKAGFCSSVLSR